MPGTILCTWGVISAPASPAYFNPLYPTVTLNVEFDRGGRYYFEEHWTQTDYVGPPARGVAIMPPGAGGQAIINIPPGGWVVLLPVDGENLLKCSLS
ncbi:uncharacterized protein E1O_06900 [Burkholderiales bacterium GJ-E10]|nr:uncharacterized protein E1O_06900 [Burkholderiales bacterium GJ-E10]